MLTYARSHTWDLHVFLGNPKDFSRLTLTNSLLSFLGKERNHEFVLTTKDPLTACGIN